MAMAEKSKNVLMYLREHQGEDLTAADVAEALGVEKRSIDGSFTSLQKKELGFREEGERENDEGKHDKVKFLRLTEKGLTCDPDAEESK